MSAFHKVLALAQAIACCLSLAAQARAEAPQLSVPLGCKPGNDCFIQNYVDHATGPGYTDYRCGALTYDDHRGTDFRLRNLSAMRAGVPVLAAADGKVRAVRNVMEDINVRILGKAALLGREAGNAVVIDHGDGWETQYSHLKKGSVAVRAGQKIKRGELLGQVGLSGVTEFPHVHFEVRHQGKPVDPFTGEAGAPSCRLGNRPLWTSKTLTDLEYKPTAILDAGISDRVLSAEEVDEWDQDKIAVTSQARQIVFWVKLMGAQAGDREVLSMHGPDGSKVAHKEGVITGNKAEWTSYVGRKSPAGRWPPGKYRGRYVLVRAGEQVVAVDAEISVSVRDDGRSRVPGG